MADKPKTYTQAQLDAALKKQATAFDKELKAALAEQRKTLEASHQEALKDAVAKAVKDAPETQEETLEVLEQKIAKLKAKNVVRAKASEAKALAQAKANRKTFKHSNGVNYAFKLDAPKTLNIDGKPQATSVLIKNKEIMAELIAGNSSFVERVN